MNSIKEIKVTKLTNSIKEIKVTKLTKKPQSKTIRYGIYGIEFSKEQSEPNVFVFESYDSNIIHENIGGDISFNYDNLKYILYGIIYYSNNIDSNIILECRKWSEEVINTFKVYE